MQVFTCTDEIVNGECSGELLLTEVADYTDLIITLNELFSFDPWLFGAVLGALAFTFVSAWSAGVTVRLLSTQ